MAKELTEEQKNARNAYARAYYAKNKDKMKTARGMKTNGVGKKSEKLAAKGAKTMAAAKDILASAAAILGEAYKTGDQKIIDNTAKIFKKQIGLVSSHNADDGTVELTIDVGVKKLRLPKDSVKQARLEFKVDDDEKIEEVAVDPATVAAMQDGDIPAELPSAYPEDEDDPFEDDPNEDETEEDDDLDENEDDDSDEDDWSEGRAEYFREMEAMGVGEEDA